jgi:tetratricopeptide (TPR) repeat protein
MYETLLTDYPDHPLCSAAANALLANPVSCDRVGTLRAVESIASRVDLVPSLALNCGHAYQAQEAYADAFAMHTMLLIGYPDHALADVAADALLANPLACTRYQMLKGTSIAGRADFMPTLYRRCGQSYQADRDYDNAVRMYEQFLADYPEHDLAPGVEVALAQAIVERSKATSAGDILPPERSRRTGRSTATVVIQNDSPQRLRIVFSGPESRVEELEACSTCETYPISGPDFCPEKGPIGRYQLGPGQYDVVVEAIDDRGITAYSGAWPLDGGNEYYNCFFVVLTLGQ